MEDAQEGAFQKERQQICEGKGDWSGLDRSRHGDP